MLVSAVALVDWSWDVVFEMGSAIPIDKPCIIVVRGGCAIVLAEPARSGLDDCAMTD